MIFIKNKKAWKEFVKEHEFDSFPDDPPSEYPLYVYVDDVDFSGPTGITFKYLYQFDAQSMLEKLENGREF